MKTRDHRERYDSVYEENLRNLIYEVTKHKMIVLTTILTKEKLNKIWISRKKRQMISLKMCIGLKGK